MSGGVLVLHPWWGLNDDVRAYAERLRGEGYQVATPDLFHGRVATTIEAAKSLSGEVSKSWQSAMTEIEEAFAKLSPQADRIAVLAAAPARFGDDEKFKPIAEVTRTRARVLLIWGSRDTQVPLTNAERYAAVLSQARVSHLTVIIDGGDHDFAPAGPRDKMAQEVGKWCRENLAP